MISQLLNRKFVIEQLQDLTSQLQQDVRQHREGGPDGGEHLQRDDYQEALAALKKSQKSEVVSSSGQPGFEPAAVRRGRIAAPLDDFSFFSRDPAINALQSALDQYFDDKAPPAEQPEITELSDDRRGSDDQVAVTDISLPGVQPSRPAGGRRIFEKFSITDAGWVSCKIAEGIRKFRHRHPFIESPPEVKIADRARLVLVGDWGSGLPRAQAVAAEMKKFVVDGKRQNLNVHVMHLGDVYYSGWKREYEKRFLKYWPVQASEADQVGSWSLNANHDMYSGGHDYYDTLLADRRFTQQNRCSYFQLFNKDWRILGLDTGWEEGGLQDPQSDWAKQSIDRSNQKVMLLSHHQLFGSYESVAPGVGKKLQGVLDTNRVRSWFWGHEHRCMLYKPFQKVEYARCIGHGGVPVYMSHDPDDPYPAPGEYEYRGYLVKGIERWALMGFVVLDFDGPSVHARYVNEYGNTHKEETFQ